MQIESPIHFEGLLPNASRTPRHEVGGLAIFDGVLMRSRTGFATAVRLPNGAIRLRQVPFASLVRSRRVLRLPVLRGTTLLAEMMVIGTRALGETATAPVRKREPSGSRTALLIGISLLMITLLLIVVPEIGARALHGLLGFGEPETSTGAFLLHHFTVSVLRVGALFGYIAFLWTQPEVRTVFAYHGAEHQAVAAMEQGSGVTVARARTRSIVHPRCGTTLMATILIMAVVLFPIVDAILFSPAGLYPALTGPARTISSMAVHVVLLPLVVGVGFELVKFAAMQPPRHWSRRLLVPGLLLQRLTTRLPNDHQREVAIVALFGALAIAPGEREARECLVRGLEDDDSAPGYLPRTPARPAPSGTEAAPPLMDQASA